MKAFIFSTLLFLLSVSTHAKIWRVNNDPTKDPDFASPTAAVASASVLAGDTLHIEPSATQYPGLILNKRLVILGNGYFLTINTGLQATTFNSDVASITINNSSADFSVLSGITTGIIQFTNVSNISITHCLIGTLRASSYTLVGVGIAIRKCFITNADGFLFSGAGDLTITIENCIFSALVGIGGSINLPATIRGLFRNNVFNNALNGITLSNFYFSNNIITQNAPQAMGGTNNIIRNNLNAGTGLPTGDGNVNSVNMAQTLVGPLTGTTSTGDARFQLTTGSLAINAGETIGTVTTPNCGAFGATDPYRLSGIPAIPSIYFLNVPASVAPTDATMDITISTRSNN
jgi:hypothetical protein